MKNNKTYGQRLLDDAIECVSELLVLYQHTKDKNDVVMKKIVDALSNLEYVNDYLLFKDYETITTEEVMRKVRSKVYH